ncbi:unnamed protein product, partial [marine sediment metagenome]
MGKRTELHKARMPRWIWQLRLPGFHVQKKKYLHFLWRQRPAGCNWSRVLRARYFNCTISTITRWDAFLVEWHLAWVSGKGTMEHRIGARPYYRRAIWELKCFGKTLPKARRTNAPPYTAQQKNNFKGYSSSATAQQRVPVGQQLHGEPPAVKETSSQGAYPPAPPGGSEGAGLEEPVATRKAKDELLWKIVYQGVLNKLLDVGWSEAQAKNLAQINTTKYLTKRDTRAESREEKQTG